MFKTLDAATRKGTPVRIYTTFGQVFDGIPAIVEVRPDSTRASVRELLEASWGNLRLYAYRVEGDHPGFKYVRRDDVARLCLLTTHVGAIVPLVGGPENVWYDR